jgi:hypothetical protein
MTNSTTFARKAKDKTTRPLRFLDTLRRTATAHLSEGLPPLPTVTDRAVEWRTVRLRPEVIATVTALQARYARMNTARPDVSVSEVIALALSYALPRLVAEEFKG